MSDSERTQRRDRAVDREALPDAAEVQVKIGGGVAHDRLAGALGRDPRVARIRGPRDVGPRRPVAARGGSSRPTVRTRRRWRDRNALRSRKTTRSAAARTSPVSSDRTTPSRCAETLARPMSESGRKRLMSVSTRRNSAMTARTPCSARSSDRSTTVICAMVPITGTVRRATAMWRRKCDGQRGEREGARAEGEELPAARSGGRSFQFNHVCQNLEAARTSPAHPGHWPLPVQPRERTRPKSAKSAAQTTTAITVSITDSRDRQSP
jgi:hypothetical protein